MSRRAKIVCTLGPTSSDDDTIMRLMEAGMDVARLNLSHGTHEEHDQKIQAVRRAATAVGRDIPILMDLQGPKIRLGLVPGDGMWLNTGDRLRLTSEAVRDQEEDRLHIDYDNLAADVENGCRILIDDGLLELSVLGVDGSDVIAEVVQGGLVRSRKGVNLPYVRPTIPALTEKDVADLEFGLSRDVEWVALSFVRTADDVRSLNQRIKQMGGTVKVLAKIEKPEALNDLDGIFEEADGIMVARGDLGIEMPLSEVPMIQKKLIRRALAASIPVITATQMLDSMIDNPRPTRAEASDVANAILDGSDAVMLSGETAVGRYPARTVDVMSQIIHAAETRAPEGYGHSVDHPLPVETPDIIMEGVSRTACRLAVHTGAKAIACLTHSGSTARAIARHRPTVPILAFTDNERVVRELALTWGTKAFAVPFQRNTDEGVGTVRRLLRENDIADEGDLIVITAGMPLPARGRTNMLHVTRL